VTKAWSRLDNRCASEPPTGDPKGVLLKHSAVVAAVSNVTNYCKVRGARVLVLFDCVV